LSKIKPIYNIFSNGIPYLKFGSGKKIMIVFQGGPGNMLQEGLGFRMSAKPYFTFTQDFTIYFVSRKSSLSENYTTLDMSNDYATMINQEFNGKVDVIIGISFGGFIIQHFAADFPEMSDYFIIAMATYKGSDEGMQFDLNYAKYISEGKPGKAFSTIPTVFISNRFMRFLLRPLFYFFGSFMKLKGETYGQDTLIEAKAEANHNARDRLREIKKPILILCGDNDYYMPLKYLKEMEQLIPEAILKIYANKGHNILTSKQFTKDIAEFIN
jgi:pimeloyl-ACP methyl ester carboxylesterase